jgi:Na+:H+ antiporter, NhaA family
VQPLREFLRTESGSGIVLFIASAIALIWANVDGTGYEGLWHRQLTKPLGTIGLDLDVRHWVNDGAMALFFFVVGVEIKRQFVDGELRRLRQAALPLIAAIGGMAAPALIYLAFNVSGGSARGWGIPMATDIAFAIGVLALVTPRVPVGLKIFLLSLAIVDDIGAIAVIALAYSDGISFAPLAAAIATLALFRLAWLLRGRALRAMALVAAAGMTWLLIHWSGVHATIAGVALAFLVPASAAEEPSPAERLEHALHPWTSFAVIPLFALANAGVTLASETLRDAIASPVAMGVFAGLVGGKIVGISGAAYLAVALRLAELPSGVSWRQVIGASALAGIGFTVSLFIAQLAFVDAATVGAAKLAIFAASLVAGVAGYLLLQASRPDWSSGQAAMSTSP